MLLKRITMTEDAHRPERDKSNQLEDVRRQIVLVIINQLCMLLNYRKCEK